MRRSVHVRTFKNRVLLKRSKIFVRKEKTYCMFFCRFGRCHNTKCKYVHDPEKVAVCTRFLRGTCRVSDCPFSHKVIPEKMPVCSFFLRGRCNNDNCPYIHVNVNPEASVCPNFAKGFCANGEKCKLRHIFVRKNSSRNDHESDLTQKQKSECVQRQNKFKNVLSKKQLSSDKLESSKCSDNTVFSGFIPLLNDARNADNSGIDLNDDCDGLTPNNIWSTLDYDSDDTWNNEEEVSDDQVKKPLIRILPRFLLDS